MIKILPTLIIIFFFVLFIWQREKKKKLKKKEEESKSNPISSVCLCTSEELKGKLHTSNQHCHSNQRIALESDFVFFVSLEIPCGRSNNNFRHYMHMGGCVGCYKRPTLITTVEVPSKGLTTKQGTTVDKPSTSEDFWTTSTHDMDNSAVQSQGSISSTSLTNQAVAPHGSSSNNPNEFVNHGLILWNQTRQRWVGNKKLENQTKQPREPKLSWNATYESLLTSNKPFRQPIPLPEMVDFLVDIWEQDGLYD